MCYLLISISLYIIEPYPRHLLLWHGMNPSLCFPKLKKIKKKRFHATGNMYVLPINVTKSEYQRVQLLLGTGKKCHIISIKIYS